MAYQKHFFTSRQALTADAMNEIEEGIVNNEMAINEIKASWNVVQNTGDSETKVMSQKAVTLIINKLLERIEALEKEIMPDIENIEFIDDGEGNVTIAGVTSTSDENGNVTLKLHNEKITFADDSEGNVILEVK